MNVTARIAEAVRILQEVQRDIDNHWPNYADRGRDALRVGTSVETALVDLERCCREEAPDLDRLVAREVRAVTR